MYMYKNFIADEKSCKCKQKENDTQEEDEKEEDKEEQDDEENEGEEQGQLLLHLCQHTTCILQAYYI